MRILSQTLLTNSSDLAQKHFRKNAVLVTKIQRELLNSLQMVTLPPMGVLRAKLYRSGSVAR